MKKSVKTWAALAVAGCMVGTMLAGCGAKEQKTATEAGADNTTGAATSDAGASGDTAAAGDKVTLRCSWWGGDTRHQAMLDVIKLYEEKNPNVTIEGEYQGYDGYYEKMMTTLSSGTAPDLMLFKREWLADVQGAKHYLSDLSKLPVDTSTLAEGLLEKSGMYAGEPVLFPCTVTGQVMYANTEFASAFGVDLDQIYSWEEFMQLGQKVHEQDGDAYLMTADIDVLNRLIIPAYIGQTTGGSLVNEESYELNFTEEQMKDALQLVLDLYDTNTVEPFGEGAVFVGQMDQNPKWVNGKIGLLLDITGGLAKYKASVSAPLDVMAIPRNSDAKCSGVDFAGNTGMCINDNSQNREEAAKFLDFLLNDGEAALIIKDAYGYNSTSTAIEALEGQGLVDETLKKAIDTAQKDSMTINAISSNTELETVRKDILQEVIYRDITPEDAAKEIVSQYQELLSELKEK